MTKVYYREISENGRIIDYTTSEDVAKEKGFINFENPDNLLKALDGFLYLREFAYAKNTEILEDRVRRKRNRLLQESDKYMIEDFPINDEEKEKIKIYRQQLRDITKSDNFPRFIEFPELVL